MFRPKQNKNLEEKSYKTSSERNIMYRLRQKFFLSLKNLSKEEQVKILKNLFTSSKEPAVAPAKRELEEEENCLVHIISFLHCCF
jgi:hypothetical protein